MFKEGLPLPLIYPTIATNLLPVPIWLVLMPHTFIHITIREAEAPKAFCEVIYPVSNVFRAVIPQENSSPMTLSVALLSKIKTLVSKLNRTSLWNERDAVFISVEAPVKGG
jgi:hypothetical protein